MSFKPLAARPDPGVPTCTHRAHCARTTGGPTRTPHTYVTLPPGAVVSPILGYAHVGWGRASGYIMLCYVRKPHTTHNAPPNETQTCTISHMYRFGEEVFSPLVCTFFHSACTHVFLLSVHRDSAPRGGHLPPLRRWPTRTRLAHHIAVLSVKGSPQKPSRRRCRTHTRTQKR